MPVASFFVKNQKAGSRTKHIDVRYHYGRELYGERKVLPAYVNTSVNYADGLTKNQPEKRFADHKKVLMHGGLIYWKEDVEIAIGLAGESCGISYSNC